MDYCAFAPGHPVHGPYHDHEYGFPLADDDKLFERLCLEIFQAGLNWELILKKRAGLNAAFDGFSIDRVSAYGDADRERLLADARIIRNRLKVNAVIENARRIQAFRESHGSFAAWLAAQPATTLDEWVKLLRRELKFMGGEIANEFLMSIGYLPGAHREDCPIYQAVAEREPRWMSGGGLGGSPGDPPRP